MGSALYYGDVNGRPGRVWCRGRWRGRAQGPVPGPSGEADPQPDGRLGRASRRPRRAVTLRPLNAVAYCTAVGGGGDGAAAGTVELRLDRSPGCQVDCHTA